MDLRRKHVRTRQLIAAAGLFAAIGAAQATVFAGKLYGPTTPDPGGGSTVPWAEIGFRYDASTTPYHLDPTSTSAHASSAFDSTIEPGSSLPMYVTGPGLGTLPQGISNQLDLYNDAGGQRVVFTSGTPHLGGIGVTLAGPAGAFFSDAMNLSTLHPGLVFAQASSGFFSMRDGSFQIFNPSVVFAAPVPEPDILTMLGIGMAGCAWAGRRRRRAVRLGYV